MAKTIKQRLEKLEEKHEPDGLIFVCERNDGFIDLPQPGGTIKVISEAEFLEAGGRIVEFGDPPRVITKDRPRAKNDQKDT